MSVRERPVTWFGIPKGRSKEILPGQNIELSVTPNEGYPSHTIIEIKIIDANTIIRTTCSRTGNFTFTIDDGKKLVGHAINDADLWVERNKKPVKKIFWKQLPPKRLFLLSRH